MLTESETQTFIDLTTKLQALCKETGARIVLCSGGYSTTITFMGDHLPDMSDRPPFGVVTFPNPAARGGEVESRSYVVGELLNLSTQVDVVVDAMVAK